LKALTLSTKEVQKDRQNGEEAVKNKPPFWGGQKPGKLRIRKKSVLPVDVSILK
jgi:hypothetical protein